MTTLFYYMKARAAFEGVAWRLSKTYLQEHFDAGVRTFFGVAVDKSGEPLSDDQQPDFFEEYRRTARRAVN